jgi:Ca2+-binding RTX toxin-like protein
MQNIIRPNDSRGLRPLRLAASVVVVSAALAAAAGLVASQGKAAGALGAGKASSHHREPAFEHPRLEHGVLTVKGTRASDRIALRLLAGHPDVLGVDVGDDGSADFSFDRSSVAKVAVDARAGDDFVRIDESNGVFTDSIPTTIDGGDGNDTIAGGKGVETLIGGNGNDSIDGNGGNDLALMGAGDDSFVWDPGDGSDTVEGQDGADTMVFNGAAVAEQIDLSPNGSRLRFFRTQANITMDTAGVERVDFNALGGADLVTVNDLSGTDVSAVNIDLAGTLGGATGDGLADRVVVNGTNGNDAINVNGDAGGVKVSGLAATVGILHSETASDRLEINTLGGRDAVDSGGLAAGAIQLFVNGALVP